MLSGSGGGEYHITFSFFFSFVGFGDLSALARSRDCYVKFGSLTFECLSKLEIVQVLIS